MTDTKVRSYASIITPIYELFYCNSALYEAVDKRTKAMPEETAPFFVL